MVDPEWHRAPRRSPACPLLPALEQRVFWREAAGKGGRRIRGLGTALYVQHFVSAWGLSSKWPTHPFPLYGCHSVTRSEATRFEHSDFTPHVHNRCGTLMGMITDSTRLSVFAAANWTRCFNKVWLNGCSHIYSYDYSDLVIIIVMVWGIVVISETPDTAELLK